jgi:hypothetical protein
MNQFPYCECYVFFCEFRLNVQYDVYYMCASNHDDYNGHLSSLGILGRLSLILKLEISTAFALLCAQSHCSNQDFDVASFGHPPHVGS